MKVAELNADILGGVLTLPKISAKYYQNYHATLRHARHHVSPESFTVPVVDGKLHTSDLLSTYASALADAQLVRDFAVASKRPELLLRASKESRSAVEWMVRHLNITDLEITEELAEFRKLETAIAQVVAEAPEFGTVLAEQLEANGQRTLSAMVSDFTKTSQLRIEQKRAETS